MRWDDSSWQIFCKSQSLDSDCRQIAMEHCARGPIGDFLRAEGHGQFTTRDGSWLTLRCFLHLSQFLSKQSKQITWERHVVIYFVTLIQLHPRILLSCTSDVISALSYLAKRRVLHCDIGAHSVFLNDLYRWTNRKLTRTAQNESWKISCVLYLCTKFIIFAAGVKGHCHLILFPLTQSKGRRFHLCQDGVGRREQSE